MKDEEQFRRRGEELREKDLKLQHQLFRFNKFLQDNEAKRRRAESRAADAATQSRLRDEEIQDLEKQLAESKQQCEDLEEEVARNMKYEEFLELVKETCDDYQEIQDLVTRYDTLEIANKDLMELQTVSNHKIEELRNNFQNYRKEQEMEMLELTNRSASLSQELDDIQKTRKHLEQQVDEATQEDSRHSLYLGRILMSVENLFLRCTTKRKNIHHDDEFVRSRNSSEQDEIEDSKAKLKVIMAYLKDFKDMVDILRKKERSNFQVRQTNPLAPVQPVEPKIKIVKVEGRAGESNSQNSGSQGTTRELSRTVREMPGASGGAATEA